MCLDEITPIKKISLISTTLKHYKKYKIFTPHCALNKKHKNKAKRKLCKKDNYSKVNKKLKCNLIICEQKNNKHKIL